MRRLLFSMAPLLALVSCKPTLDDVGSPLPQIVLDAGGGGGGGSGPSEPTGELIITVEPPTPVTAAPPVLRLHASLAGWTFDPNQMALVTGVLTSRELTEFTTDKLSATIAKRLVPVVTWSEGAGEALAPTEVLALGATYTLVMADVPAALQITIVSEDPVPLLSRVWPPEGASGTAELAVWCGPRATAGIDEVVTTEPSGDTGRLSSRVVPDGAGRACLRFDASSVPPPPVAVPPPFVASAGRLDPRPIQFDHEAAPPSAARCKPGEVRFGPGCATVLDDRILARSAPVPVLWAIAGAGVDFVAPEAPNEPFVVSGLRPSSAITLDVAAIDAAGRTTRGTFAAKTSAPLPHLILNEVLAWPLGPSPAEEWVEILNDGLATATLDGFVLLVGDQTTKLPAGSLAPGAFALVVSQAFVADDGVDVVPAPSASLVTVPHLGKEGLSKKGETFALLDESGSIVSAFPATPKPKLGRSVARRTPSSPDGVASSFALATPTPGAPNQIGP